MFEKFIKERIYLKNVSANTVDWYRNSFKWLKVENPTKADLTDFVIRMREAGLKPVSCNNRIRAVRAYLAWLGVSETVSYLKEEQLILPTYTADQLKRLVGFRPETFGNRRLHTLVLTILDTGLRIESALTIRVEDVDFDNLLIKVKVKGNKERLVPFSYELRKVLWKWKSECKFGLLFATRHGGKLGRRNVLRDFKGLCKRLGFEAVPRSIHALRHTFAVNYLRQGGSVFHLQKALGHSSLEMSRRYANLMIEDLQQMQHRVSLLNHSALNR